jgi:hypothetical protein
VARGDHLRVWNPDLLVWHHGIDLGDGQVVHFMSPNGSKTLARVRITPRSQFGFPGQDVQLVEHEPGAAGRELVVQRALSLVGLGGYRLLTCNCEHVARWCVYGRKGSWQVRYVLFNLLAPVTLSGMRSPQRQRHFENLRRIDGELRRESGLHWVPRIKDSVASRTRPPGR